MYYHIQRGESDLDCWPQRKQPLHTVDTPMREAEYLIIDLCKEVMRLQKFNQDMVKKAAENNLEGYREQATKIVMLEELLHEYKDFVAGLLKAAHCPNPGCVNGVIPVQVSDTEWEPMQCQWCHERDTAIQKINETGE